MEWMRPLAGVLLSTLVTAGCAAEPAPAKLPRLHLDPARTTVSGLSSGAYMATQVHVAFSNHIAGVAMLAGGPWGCAGGSLNTALGSCLMPEASAMPDVASLVGKARSQAAAGNLASLDGLKGDRVFIFHGTSDATVAAWLSTAAAEFYRELGGSVVMEDLARDTGHVFPTLGKGNACTEAAPPFIGNCGFDAAGELLGKLVPGKFEAAKSATGELLTFDQNAYRPEGKEAFLSGRGYLYVPKACAAGETCALHIALHGCQQTAESIGEAFVRDAGYNRWADAMHLVVLYPQTRTSMMPLNPKACWDWWGYSGADYDTRKGVQLRWLANVAAALGAPLE